MTKAMKPALGAAAILALAAGAASADMPMRRGGLWEAQITGGPMNAANMTVKSCVDPAQQKGDSPFSNGRQPPGCVRGEVTPVPGGGWAYHQVCKPGGAGMTMDMRGVATGDFRSNYTIQMVTRMTPAPMPSMAESRMTIKANYLGACPAGMKPGESEINGRRVAAYRGGR